MKITKIKISSFGALREREFSFSDGINLVEGENEAGKTSLAMFIKFAFYGLSGRASASFPMSERKRFINWDTGCAEGSVEFEYEDKMYRIERSVSYTGNGDAVREKKTVLDLGTLSQVNCTGEPGESFFGMPESVFVNTVFVRQLGSNSVDSAEISSAVENILSSGDENVNVKKVISDLDKVRRQLMHKIGGRGEIPELEGEVSALESALDEAEKQNSEIIDTESKLKKEQENAERLKDSIARLENITKFCGDIAALRKREEHKNTLDEYARASEALEKAQRGFDESGIRDEIAGLRAELKTARDSRTKAGEKLAELRRKAASAPAGAEADFGSASERAESMLAKSKSRRTAGVLLTAGAVMSGVLAAVPAARSMILAAAALALTVIFLIISACFFASSSGAKKELSALLAKWGVSSVEELKRAEAEKAEELRAAALAREQIGSAEAGLREIDEQIAELESRVRALPRLLPSLIAETDSMDCDAVIELCEKEAKRVSGMISDLKDNVSKLSGRCQHEESELAAYDFGAISLRELEFSDTPEWREAERLDSAGINRAERELRMERDKLRISEGKTTDYKESLAKMRATAKSPAEIAEKLTDRRAGLEEKQLRYDAIRFAIDTLNESGERLRGELMPKITENASAMFAASTMGKYTDLGVSSDFQMNVSDGDRTREAAYLSAGSSDAAYVCLRVSLAKVLFGTKEAPLIFDESFARIDEDRLGRLFTLLAASGLQTLVFTCRRAEKDLIPADSIITL